jgi:hypothetical protein
MQPCNRIRYSRIYWRFSVFRVAYHSSSGAPNCICSLWFIYTCGDWLLCRLGGNWVPTQPGQRPVTACVYKPEAANTVWSSWWRAVCCSNHAEPSVNSGIMNSINKVASCWLFLLIHTTMHGSMNIKFRITTFWTTLAVSLSKLLFQPVVVLDILSCFVTKGMKKVRPETKILYCFLLLRFVVSCLHNITRKEGFVPKCDNWLSSLKS